MFDIKKLQINLQEKLKKLLLSLSVVIIVSTAVWAVPMLNPANGHYYDIVSGSFSWDEASLIAQNSTYNGKKGHLVTITSKSENDWVWNSFDHPSNHHLGGYYDDTTGQWQWVNNESFGYSNFGGGSSSGSKGNTLAFGTGGAFIPFSALLLQNNENDEGFVVEFDVEEDENTENEDQRISNWDGDPNAYPVPEPASMLLFGSGLLGAFRLRKRTVA